MRAITYSNVLGHKKLSPNMIDQLTSMASMGQVTGVHPSSLSPLPYCHGFKVYTM